MAALATISSLQKDEEFGGVISIGGRLPESTSTPSTKRKTPIMVCGGNRNTEVTKQQVERLKAGFKDTEYVKWEREGDGMMRSREEVLPLMRFWGRRLRSRMGVPDGALEL